MLGTIILIALLVLGVAVIGVFIYRNNQKKADTLIEKVEDVIDETVDKVKEKVDKKVKK